MRFKETFLIDDVRELKALKQTAMVKIIKTNAKKERKEYVAKAFDESAEKAKKLKGCVVVGTITVMSSNNEFCSEIAISNLVKLEFEIKKDGEDSRTYDSKHY